MSPSELKECRKSKKMTQAAFAEWLGCSKHSVVSWEIGRNPVPDWVIARIRSDKPVLNPSLTLEEFRQVQEAADREGVSIEKWIANIIKKAIQLIVFLAFIAKLMSDPTDWSGEALAQAAGTGCVWFGKGLAWLVGGMWELGGQMLASL